MKKRSSILTKILSLIIALICAIGVFSGCSLVKTDTVKDSNLVVAKVQIEDDIDPITIYKKDMFSAYVAYGYYYVNNYGYSVADTYQMILDNLEQNAVVEQFAKKELVQIHSDIKAKQLANEELTDFQEYFINNVGKISGISDVATETLQVNGSLDSFITEYQYAESIYTIKKSINDLIDSFVEEDEEEHEEHENVSLTARENPFEEETEEELEEWELKDKTPTEKDLAIAAKTLGVEVSELPAASTSNMFDLNLYMYKTYNYDVSTKQRQRAFNQAISGYRSLGIIDKNEYHSSNNALEYEYFKNQIETEKAQQIVLFYQASLEDQVKAEQLTNQMLYKDYQDLYRTQELKFKNDYSAYETAMGSATKDAPIVYHPYNGYGYVSNLLLGFNDAQTAELTLYKGQKGISAENVVKFRDNLAKTIIVKDQRVSWATSGLGVYESDKYTFDSKYLLTENATLKDKISSFIGKVENAYSHTEEDENGIEKTEWFVSNGVASSIGYNSFYNDYLVACLGFNSDINAVTFNTKTNTGFDTLTNYDDNSMRDLIYAFSTDPGSVTSKNGYLYSPFTSATQYVSEFAAAAKAIVEAGEGAYTLVVTDYGVHVMVCLDKISATTQMIGTEFIDYLDGKANTLTEEQKEFIDNFKKNKQDSLISSYVSEKANTFVKKYLEEDSESYATTFYKDNYKDLI